MKAQGSVTNTVCATQSRVVNLDRKYFVINLLCISQSNKNYETFVWLFKTRNLTSMFGRLLGFG